MNVTATSHMVSEQNMGIERGDDHGQGYKYTNLAQIPSEMSTQRKSDDAELGFCLPLPPPVLCLARVGQQQCVCVGVC